MNIEISFLYPFYNKKRITFYNIQSKENLFYKKQMRSDLKFKKK